jgi:TolB-like protein
MAEAGETTAGAGARTAFISYASQDAVVANQVVSALERAGITCWIAPRDVTPGALYAGEIVRGINDCRIVVLVLSANSAASAHVGKELERASSKNRRIITLRLDATALPAAFEYFLSESQWIDIAEGGIESSAAKVVEAVSRHRNAVSPHAVSASPIAAKASISPSIAVLPFANMSGDKEQEYFSDGLAEEIINALAQIQGLKVIARTSAFAFRGQNTDIRRIAETLGVTHVLEGSVRRAGNRIRVTAQLITAIDGSHLWSERYDRELADVFAVQDEISAAISEALKVRLSQTATPRHTPTLPAYEALLKARHFHWKATLQSMDQAKVCYEQAIALDPKFAAAHVLYADFLFGRTTMATPLREAVSECRALAQRALELEPSLADAHAPLLVLASTHDYDWKEAGRQYALAMAGGQASPQTHLTCGYFHLFASGRRDEAVAHLETAVRGDPLHLMHRAGMRRRTSYFSKPWTWTPDFSGRLPILHSTTSRAGCLPKRCRLPRRHSRWHPGTGQLWVCSQGCRFAWVSQTGPGKCLQLWARTRPMAWH